MGDGVSFNVGEALTYIESRTRSLFGKDPVSESWRVRINKLLSSSVSQASTVQCIGMPRPIPIRDIYQPTRLRNRAQQSRECTVDDVLHAQTSCVIFAGPGWGKTTLLHWIYALLVDRGELLPILFTLRWPGVLTELLELIDYLAEGKYIKELKAVRLLLLIDGYDEVTEADRLKLSGAMMLYKSLNLGDFYLTCRSHYAVSDIQAEEYDLAPFAKEDSVGFINAYAQAYGHAIDPNDVLIELEQHGFYEFASHPLMLTLVCILRTSANPEIPRLAIRLVERAIDTLTFKWDEAKMIHRPSTLPLDGRERMRCLLRVAFDMTRLQASQHEVEQSVLSQLYLLQRRNIDVRALLAELAQWYGILIPVEQGQWTFVHRTIHDFLAARFWVESGSFAPQSVREWNLRAVYATCLLQDATQALARILLEASDLSSFSESLYNGAAFHPVTIAKAVVVRTARTQRFTHSIESDHFDAATEEDFYRFASAEFLKELVCIGSNEQNPPGEAVAICALAELHRRGSKLPKQCLLGRIGTLYEGCDHIELRTRSGSNRARFRFNEVIV